MKMPAGQRYLLRWSPLSSPPKSLLGRRAFEGPAREVTEGTRVRTTHFVRQTSCYLSAAVPYDFQRRDQDQTKSRGGMRSKKRVRDRGPNKVRPREGESPSRGGTPRDQASHKIDPFLLVAGMFLPARAGWFIEV